MKSVTSPNWIEAGLSLVYPPVCQVCDEERVSPEQGYICAECRKRVRFIEPPYCKCCGLPFEGDLTTPFECSNCRDIELYFSHARSAVSAGEVILDVIHRYKYHRALWFEPFLAELLVRQAVPELASEKWDMIVPVPLHPTKEREREFNQAVNLAGHLARATGLPVNKNVVRRVISTGTQTLLSRESRQANVRRAFAVCDGRAIKGKKIVLVDDVLTTGSTTSACARVLRKAGASEVCVWTVARGL